MTRTTFLVFSLGLTILHSAPAVASSVVTDAHAKEIRRTMASESLRRLSTREQVAPERVDITEVTVETSSAAADNQLRAGTESASPIDPRPSSKVYVGPAPETRQSAREPAAQPHEPEHPAAHPGSHSDAPSVPAEKALTWLQNGNKRYLTRSVRVDGRGQKDRDRLSKGQHPHAIVLSCADSRVPPETVFDQSLGEIFVVRTAGEGLDSSVIASLEYAVEHLGPRLLVVMGHTSCGAVKAAMETPEGKTAGSPSLDSLVADIRPRLPHRSPASPSARLEIESTANAKGVAGDLLKRSAIIRSRVEKGDLIIKPALYYIDSGEVKFH